MKTAGDAPVGGRGDRLACAATACAFLALYALTLAPTVQCGDAASFEVRAVRPGVGFYARGHPVYTLVTKAFAHLPVGNVAYRVNLVSLFFGVISVWMVCRLILSLTGSRAAAVFAGVSLGLSHMFWVHAVRAEIWTMQSALMIGLVWALMAWRSDRPQRLYAAGLLVPLLLFHHRITLVSLPAVAWIIFAKRGQLRGQGRHALLAAAACVALLGALVAWGYLDEWRFQGFRQAARGWLPMESRYGQAPDISPRAVAFDFATLIGAFGYSFFGPALLLGFAGIARAHVFLGRAERQFLLLLLLLNVGFATAYNIGHDKPMANYVPAVVVWALYSGIGMAWLGRESGLAYKAVLVVAQAVLPVLLYSCAPLLVGPLQRMMPQRSREDIVYWVTPWAQGNWRFRQRGEALLRVLPARSVLLVDYRIYGTLDYLQRVDDVRRDVAVVLAAPDDEREWRAGFEQGDRPTFLLRSLRYKDVPPGYTVSCKGELCQISRGEKRSGRTGS